MEEDLVRTPLAGTNSPLVLRFRLIISFSLTRLAYFLVKSKVIINDFPKVRCYALCKFYGDSVADLGVLW